MNRKTAQRLGYRMPEEEGKPQTVYFQPPKKKKYPVEWLNLWQNVDTGSR